MATCRQCHQPMLTERPHYHPGSADVVTETEFTPLPEPAPMPVELVRSCGPDPITELRGANARIDWLEELLRRVVMDYGHHCETEGCQCSMAQAKATVTEWNPTDRPR